MTMLADAIRYVQTGGSGGSLLSCRELYEVVAAHIDETPVVAHPLGFAHFELTSLAADLRPGERVRLHLWSDATRVLNQDGLGGIHDHYWDLRSAVVTGGLTNLEYVARSAPDGSYELWHARYFGSQPQLMNSGTRWSLRVAARQRMHSGDAYWVAAGTPHETNAWTRPTVTLVVSSAPNRTEHSASIFAPVGCSPPLGGERTRLADATALELLSAALLHTKSQTLRNDRS